MRAPIWIAVLCACSKSDNAKPAPKSEPPPEQPAKKAPAALDSLHVTLAGKPIAMTHALLKKLAAGERYQIYVTNQGTSCRQLMENLFNSHDGEQTVLFNTGEKLSPDGTLTPVVTDYFDKGGGEIAPGSKVSVKDGKVTADFAAKGPSGALEVHGTFAAENCGDQAHDNSGEPKAKHPSTATLTFAGKSLPVGGAVLFKNDLLLTTGVKACDRWVPTAPIMLWRSGGFWHANGTWLDVEATNNALPDDKTKDIKITRGAKGTSDDGPTIQLALSGKGTIDKYPFTLTGTIEAIDCQGSDSGVIP